MFTRTLSFAILSGFLMVLLPGCYGSQNAEMCQACQAQKEGKAEGEEWSAEYINSKFQCKLEGGQVKLKQGDSWSVCK